MRNNTQKSGAHSQFKWCVERLEEADVSCHIKSIKQDGNKQRYYLALVSNNPAELNDHILNSFGTQEWLYSLTYKLGKRTDSPTGMKDNNVSRRKNVKDLAVQRMVVVC